jgi:hypothetical protein
VIGDPQLSVRFEGSLVDVIGHLQNLARLHELIDPDGAGAMRCVAIVAPEDEIAEGE